MEELKLMNGNNIELLKELEDNSIDSVVTDGPYGLSAAKNSGKTSNGGFMGKKWDYDVPSTEFWSEVYRVLKPGGHVLSFGGTRTYHRMVVNIEDAGFEIRDQIMWLYGSGFPKSHNIGKAVDKMNGVEREVVGERTQRGSLKEDVPFQKNTSKHDTEIITKGTSEYEGWGTALKPANEPICVARKPISEKTVAKNVLKWGTGGINVDGCRVGDEKITINGQGNDNLFHGNFSGKIDNPINEGRFPANIILDEEAGKVLDEQSGISKGKVGMTQLSSPKNIFNGFKSKSNTKINDGTTDQGGASRFFYCAKVGKKERNMGMDGFEEKENNNIYAATSKIGRSPDKPTETKKNNHPTVKPISLMTYLVRLVTPKGGTVLDPFMGSGSTGISTLLEGFRFIGMEMDEDYFKIASERINNYENYRQFIKK